MSEDNFEIKFKEGFSDCKKCNNILDKPFTCKFVLKIFVKIVLTVLVFFVKMEMIKKMIIKKMFNFIESF